MHAFNPTCNVGQRPKKANEIRWPHLPGLESAWEPQLQCPEPKVVMRNCDDIAIFPLFSPYFSIPLCSAVSAPLCSTTNPQSTDFSVFHQSLLHITLFSSAVLTDVTS